MRNARICLRDEGTDVLRVSGAAGYPPAGLAGGVRADRQVCRACACSEKWTG